MTRTVSPPEVSIRTIDQFYGMVRDRGPSEMDEHEFYDLFNARNNDAEGIDMRPGGKKYQDVTDAPGTKTYGLFEYIGTAGSSLPLKIADGKLYKFTAGAWTQVDPMTSLVIANADAYFATMNTKQTGAAASDTGTTTASDQTSVTDSTKAYTQNQQVGRILEVGGEKKLIGGNNATQVIVKERFDNTPAATGASFSIYPRQLECFFANGTNFFKTDGTTITQLDNNPFAYAFDGVEAHNGRLFGWKGTRLHWSDLGVGEHFSRNSWYDTTTTILRVKSFGNFLCIYERNRVTIMAGDNPDNFQWTILFPNVGTISGKSVATYQGKYQFFLSDIGVVIISGDDVQAAEGGKSNPVSVSRTYIQSLIDAESSADKALSCAEVYGDNYFLCIGSSWYVLNVHASEGVQFKAWIWQREDRPDAMDANVLAIIANTINVGAQDNGQIYQIETGFTDDGTAINFVFEKQKWNVLESSDIKRFWTLNMTQRLTQATTMNYFIATDNNSYGSAIQSVDLSTQTTDFQRIKITGNVTDRKNIGRVISYKITASSSVGMGRIEQLDMNFFPSIIN